jgi:ATP-binding cassette, subfamily B, bacterial PglK
MNVQVIRQVWEILLPAERVRLGILFLLMVIGALLETLGVGAIPAFIALLADPTVLNRYPWVAERLEAWGLSTHEHVVVAAVIALMVVFLVKNSYLVVLEYAKYRYLYNRRLRFMRQLFESYLRRPYAFHLQRNSADLIRNVQLETGRTVNGVMTPLLKVGMEILVLVAVFGTLLYFEPVITLVAIFGFGLLGGMFYRGIRARIARHGLKDQEAAGRMIQTVQEGLGGLKDIKVLGREEFFVQTFLRNARDQMRAQRFEKVAEAFPRSFVETAAVFGLLGVAFLFILQGRPVQSVIPTLALFGAATIRLMPSFNRILTYLPKVRYNEPAARVVHAELVSAHQEAQPHAALASPQLDSTVFQGGVRFEGVGYRYPGADKPALRGLALDIPAGSMVGLIGPSGAGKTTVVDLLLGLLSPNEGRILGGGRDIREDLHAWQAGLGYIPQHIFLLDGTIRRNVALGLPDGGIDEGRVWEALEHAEMADFVHRLPDGLDTVVGERGVRFSGGQRQRIGIARALYGDPRILVMDEATSAVDTATERRVIRAVEALRGERTIMMIAHRLSTLKSCDRLFQLENGRLIGQGTYDELYERSSAFRTAAGAPG